MCCFDRDSEFLNFLWTLILLPFFLFFFAFVCYALFIFFVFLLFLEISVFTHFLYIFPVLILLDLFYHLFFHPPQEDPYVNNFRQ